MKKQPHIWNECIVKWKSAANQQNKYVLVHRLREFRVYYADFFFFPKPKTILMLASLSAHQHINHL